MLRFIITTIGVATLALAAFAAPNASVKTAAASCRCADACSCCDGCSGGDCACDDCQCCCCCSKG